MTTGEYLYLTNELKCFIALERTPKSHSYHVKKYDELKGTLEDAEAEISEIFHKADNVHHVLFEPRRPVGAPSLKLRTERDGSSAKTKPAGKGMTVSEHVMTVGENVRTVVRGQTGQQLPV